MEPKCGSKLERRLENAAATNVLAFRNRSGSALKATKGVMGGAKGFALYPEIPVRPSQEPLPRGVVQTNGAHFQSLLTQCAWEMRGPNPKLLPGSNSMSDLGKRGSKARRRYATNDADDVTAHVPAVCVSKVAFHEIDGGYWRPSAIKHREIASTRNRLLRACGIAEKHGR